MRITTYPPRRLKHKRKSLLPKFLVCIIGCLLAFGFITPVNYLLSAIAFFLFTGIMLIIGRLALNRLHLPKIYWRKRTKSMFLHAGDYFLGGKKNRYLINQPKLKKSFLRSIEAAISATAWAIFLYFFQPLFTIGFWVISGQWIYLHVFSASTIEATINMIIYSFYFAVLIMFVLISWATWNYWHYGRLERRKPRPSVPDSAVAMHFSVPLKTVYGARNAKLAMVIPTFSGVVFKIKKYNNDDRLLKKIT